MFFFIRNFIYKTNQNIKYFFSFSYFIPNEEKKLFIKLSYYFKELFFIKKNQINNKKFILVEGHLTEYGINYLFRLTLLSKMLRFYFKNDIIICFNGKFSNHWRKVLFYFKIIGFKNFYFFDWELKTNKSHLINNLSLNLWNSISSPSDIIGLKIDDVIIGDLLYDQILKSEGIYTINEIKLKYKIYLDHICKLYLDYNFLFKKYNVSYYLSTHTAYIDYGMLCRIALKNNVCVIETTDIHLAVFFNNKILPTYHQGFNNTILNKIKSIEGNELKKNSLIEKYIKHLEQRLNNNVKQIDVDLAYGNKCFYNREKLHDKYEINQSKINVFIVAHVFSDSPHTSEKLLFKDYFDWFFQTVNFLNSFSDNYNCFVKIHPSAELYGEKNLIKQILLDNNLKNIILLEEDFSPKSFVECSDIIITCQGTVGLEFSCYGIPIVTAGKAFYSGFGYTLDSENADEYFNILSSLEKYKKLSYDQVRTAKYIYALYNESIISENKIITTDVLKLIWGYGVDPDPKKAFKQVLKNIENHGVLSHPIYEKMLEAIELYQLT